MACCASTFYVAVQSFPGRPGKPKFCVHPNGRSGFIYIDSCFLHIDLYSGVKTRIKAEGLEKIHEIPVIWCDFIAFSRPYSDFIVGLILRNDTRKYCLVLFSIDGQNEQKLTLLSEHCIELKVKNENQRCSLQQNEDGDIFCIIYWRNIQETKTFFHALKVNAKMGGRMSTTHFEKDKSVFGDWIQPFVYGTTLFWLPRCGND